MNGATESDRGAKSREAFGVRPGLPALSERFKARESGSKLRALHTLRDVVARRDKPE